MTGTLYGVGVGPGDPELITLKAVRILQEADVVAVPISGSKKRLALEIAAAYVQGKPLLYLEMPMTSDQEELERCHDAAFEKIGRELDQGHLVAFVTLGDPSLYSTFTYLQRRTQQAGYPVQAVPGVPSFCAVAARAQVPLAEGSEVLTILPAPYETGPFSTGNLVFMKVGRHFDRLYQALGRRLDQAVLVEKCGLEGERVLNPGDGDRPRSYFSTMIVKQGREKA